MTRGHSTIAKGIMFTEISGLEAMTCPVNGESLSYFNERYRATREGNDQPLAWAYEYAYDAISSTQFQSECTIYKHRFAMRCERQKGISRKVAEAAWGRFRKIETHLSTHPAPITR